MVLFIHFRLDLVFAKKKIPRIPVNNTKSHIKHKEAVYLIELAMKWIDDLYG